MIKLSFVYKKRAAEDVQQAGPNYIRNRIAEYKQEFGELSVDGIQNKEAEYNLKLIKKKFCLGEIEK